MDMGKRWSGFSRVILFALMFLLVPAFASAVPTVGQSAPEASQAKKSTAKKKSGQKSQSTKAKQTPTRGSQTSAAKSKGAASATSPAVSSKAGKGTVASNPNVRASQNASGKRSKKSNKSAEIESYKAAVVMNAKTGEIVHEENSHRKLVPASLTKMMLALVVMEKVRTGSLRLVEPVTASDQTCAIGGTQIDLQPGETLALEDMLQAIIIRSANDAAASVAEHVGGTQDHFVEMMNARAQKLGMADTSFSNVHGLPCRDGNDNMTTAYDMAILAKELLRFPEVLQWSSKEIAYIRDGQYPIHSTNKLLGSTEGVDGLKTGFIRKAGFNIAATARRDDTRLIAVVMGSPSSQTRNTAARALLSQGFDRYDARSAGSRKTPSRSGADSAFSGGPAGQSHALKQVPMLADPRS
jgi:D-alanyl-D-alanine carboxypeptidase